MKDTLHPDRIVLGVASDRAEKVMREVYAFMLAMGTPMVITDYPTAELVKVAANAFLATKISFINAMAEVCEAAHADVKQLSLALFSSTTASAASSSTPVSASAAAACPRTSAPGFVVVYFHRFTYC